MIAFILILIFMALFVPKLLVKLIEIGASIGGMLFILAAVLIAVA